MLNPRVRTYIYGITLAVVPILIFYGIVSSEVAPLIISLVTSILGLGTAFANNPVAKPTVKEAPVAVLTQALVEKGVVE